MEHYIGIDLDESYMKAGVVDEKGILLCKERIRTRADRKANEIVRDIAYLAQNVIQTSQISLDEIQAIGIASPGIPDNTAGTVMYSRNLPLHNMNIRNDIRRIMPLPVYIENNTNCKALAESLFGAAKGMEHSIILSIGADIAGGVIINRRIYSGFNHAASEMGHFILVEDGEPCSCGRNGCFAAYASETALFRDMARAAKKRPNSLLSERMKQDMGKTTVKALFEAVQDGDEAATGVMENYIHSLSLGLANIIGFFMPEAIVLDGQIGEEGDFLLQLIHEEIKRIKPYPAGIRKTQVKAAETGDDKGIVGAAMMAMLSQMDGIKGD